MKQRKEIIFKITLADIISAVHISRGEEWTEAKVIKKAKLVFAEIDEETLFESFTDSLDNIVFEIIEINE